VLPFTTALSEAPSVSEKASETEDEKKSGVTNKDLLEAISSISSFDLLYMVSCYPGILARNRHRRYFAEREFH